jgi:hypothetical protein
MERSGTFSGVLAAGVLFSAAAQAQLLTVVEVSAPAVNCVFRVNCTIPVSDTTSNILLPFAPAGTVWLQSRTYTGEAGTPGAGLTGYDYRISMTQASGTGCVLGFTLNFGPSKQLPYKDNQLADVFVITGGGLGTIGIKTAERFGDAIQFTLASPLCADGAPDVKKTTFFIGIAAAAAPMHVNGTVFAVGDPAFFSVDARVPTHSVPADPPGGF